MSGRGDISEDYKAQRRPRPDLLQEQWPQLQPLVEAFGYTNVKVPGFEADDVIATLTRQAREQGIEVMVVTGDRDMFQLIEPGVRVMATSRGITETKIYDAEAVLERYGIGPQKIPDFYGLKGDTSDNIPGVPGIGDKTASQLLQQFGDLEGVLANIDQISGAKRKQNLTEHADDARMSKQLATANREVELSLDLEASLSARARPLAPAGGVPGVRAARSAAAAGGGARGARGRAAVPDGGRARGSRSSRCPCRSSAGFRATS